MPHSQEALADWIKSYNWDYFLTVTPRNPRKDPIAFMRDTWARLGEVKGFGIDRGFMACEPFKTHHDLHIHGLIAGSDIELPWMIQATLDDHIGRSRVELAMGASQVSAYCAKYVVKDQNSDHWNMFGDWHRAPSDLTSPRLL